MSSASHTVAGNAATLFSKVRKGEWLGVAIIAIVDAIWAQAIGFHVVFAPGDFGLIAFLVVVAAGLHLRNLSRGAMIAEYLVLSLVMAKVFTVFCYLAFASSGAMMDKPLLAIDRALGFDWPSGYRFLSAHDFLGTVLADLYDSLNFQALYVCVFLGLIAREAALKELFWLLFVAALITNIVAIFVPAYGPFEDFGLASQGPFLPDMKQIKAGHDWTFALAKMTGVICFPSFHTVMALAYAWAVRRTGVIGYALAAANFAMLFSVPYCGGHYLIDMIAGAGVMVASVLIVKTVQEWLSQHPFLALTEPAERAPLPLA